RRRVGDRTGAPVIAQRAATCGAWPPAGPKQSGTAGCSRLCFGGDGSFLLGARLPLPPARPAPAADGRAPGDEGSVERGDVMSLLRAFRRDIQAALERDPSARHWLEVLLVYPGVHALFLHRIAHVFWRWRLHLVARIIAHVIL